MRIRLWIALLALSGALNAAPATTNNDDSCDISLLPAATLLLPYFSVDLNGHSNETTLFTITNVTDLPQIAQVTIWTDRAYPVLTFSVFLTGYDVHGINLGDILGSGTLARGSDVSACADLPTTIPPAVLESVRSALTVGLDPNSGCNSASARVGSIQPDGHAVGYVTVDVTGDCQPVLPTDASYFREHILYDNVLIGDYQQINPLNNFAQGGTLVHIRAIPEGGAQRDVLTSFDRTFYSRLQNGGTSDRRQPLPSTFAARWTNGGVGELNSSFKIWREAVTGPSAGCNVVPNRDIAAIDIVRFDEEENPHVTWYNCTSCYFPPYAKLPPASRVSTANTEIFPPNRGYDLGGWMYLNLADGSSSEGEPLQGWVTVSMDNEGRFATDFDAVALGNGCSAAAPITAEDGSEPLIGPAPNTRSTEARFSPPSTIDNDDSCDISLQPAATLLLPYFEVDLQNYQQADTHFTITNVSYLPQVARVTLWTDQSYPVLTFKMFLTGYDVQAISMYDILGNGIIAPPDGTSSDFDVGERSANNDDNPLLDVSQCDTMLYQLPEQVRQEVMRAFTMGIAPSPYCHWPIGRAHERAIGYATIDVVSNCGAITPSGPSSLVQELLFDNVLIGEYQIVDRANNHARGGPLVHIRAVPEGGTRASAATALTRTFYGRYQSGSSLDRRQPLPSTFAARWISSAAGDLETHFTIWHEVSPLGTEACDWGRRSSVALGEVVRFDEDENPVVGEDVSRIAGTSRLDANGQTFPPNPGDAGGWMSLNPESQGWVIVSMAAEDRYSVDFDAVALGNGCTAPVP